MDGMNPTVTPLTGSQADDAGLFELYEMYLDAEGIALAMRKAADQMGVDKEQYLAADGAEERLDRLARAIAQIPAKTLAGMLIKLRLSTNDDSFFCGTDEILGDQILHASALADMETMVLEESPSYCAGPRFQSDAVRHGRTLERFGVKVEPRQ